MGGIGHRTASARRGPVLIDVVGHTFRVGSPVLAQTEGIATGHVEFVAWILTGVVGQTCLAVVVPFENTVRRDAAGQHIRQLRYLKVAVGGDEATAVTTAPSQSGKSHHVAALQLETADAVVEFVIAEGVHETATVLQSEVVGGTARKIGA